jgi:hypothetical protein
MYYWEFLGREIMGWEGMELVGVVGGISLPKAMSERTLK